MIRQILLSGLTVMRHGGAGGRNRLTALRVGPARAAGDEIICQKTLETGSLVRKTKQCFSRAGWYRLQAAHRAGNQRLPPGLRPQR